MLAVLVNILGVIITTKPNYLLRVHGGTLFRATSEAADGIEKIPLKVSI